MSHVGNGEHDFDGLEQLNLDEKTLNSVRRARIQARESIDRLEPFHISSHADLLAKLADCFATAADNAIIDNPEAFCGLENDSIVKIFLRFLPCTCRSVSLDFGKEGSIGYVKRKMPQWIKEIKEETKRQVMPK
ncbi:MAG: hypothetical protein HY764_00895 [Candidatus Portnoybacteria bacterium]|nr:hypothetical protein [Candidatus Portnoybacteria bacterium]